MASGGTAPGSIDGGATATAGGAVRKASISATVIAKIRCTAGHSIRSAFIWRSAALLTAIRVHLKLLRLLFSGDGRKVNASEMAGGQ